MTAFSVIGSGAWGSAVALQLSKNEPVTLFGKGIGPKSLPSSLLFTTDIKEAAQAEFIVLAVPSYAIKQVMDTLKTSSITPHAKLIIATKGLMDDGEFISDAAEKLLEKEVSVLAGPNLALEVASNVPSAAMIGAKDIKLAKKIADRMSTDTFKLMPTTELFALQISGCIKNIAAIISGALEGLEYGENSKAWIFSMALKDISMLTLTTSRLCSQEAIASVGIAGDLALCFYSKRSRNYAFGMELAKAACRAEFINSYQVLVEGKRNALIVKQLAEKYEVKSVLASTLCAILANPQDLEKEIVDLLNIKRP
jgi:glycerol-3-phosphate dehydrogenase (NAD(P)+)